MLDRLLGRRGRPRAVVPVSGWRSRAEQQAIWDGALAEHGPAFTETYVARPGCSEHQTGPCHRPGGEPAGGGLPLPRLPR